MIEQNSDNNEILLNNYTKNDKQKKYNEIIGDVSELNDGEEFCSVTIMSGSDRPREVNFCIKKPDYNVLIENGLSVHDKVKIFFFPTSKRDRNNNKRFYNNNNIIGVERFSFNK
jgi:hypothetical protein